MADPRTDHPHLDESDHLAPVPDDNRPGHHPDVEQDKPDLDAFRERFNHAGEPGEQADDTVPGGDTEGDDSEGSAPAEIGERVRSAVDTVRAKASNGVPAIHRLRSMAARGLRELANLLEPDSTPPPD